MNQCDLLGGQAELPEFHPRGVTILGLLLLHSIMGFTLCFHCDLWTIFSSIIAAFLVDFSSSAKEVSYDSLDFSFFNSTQYFRMWVWVSYDSWLNLQVRSILLFYRFLELLSFLIGQKIYCCNLFSACWSYIVASASLFPLFCFIYSLFPLILFQQACIF
jgi:hypothetical protein